MGSYNLKLIASACTVNFLALASGSAFGWSSPAIVSLKKENDSDNPLGRPITTLEESWIASLVNLGAACGPILAGFCSAKFGRKRTLLMASVPMLLAYLILIYASTPSQMYVARLMLGVGIGCVFTVMPMYVGEIAETSIRGLLGCLLSVFISLGVVFVYTVGPMVNFATLNFILMVPIVLFQFLFGLFVPESPYYYIKNSDELSAQRSLRKLRKYDHSSLLKELEEIKETVEESEDSESSLWQHMKAKSFRKGITISTSLAALQHFVGISTVLSYMHSIFIASGSTMSSSTSAILVSMIKLCSGILSSYLSDRLGRRLLLLLSTSGTLLPLSALGLYFYMKNSGSDVSSLWWLPILCLIIFVTSYNFGLGGMPFVLAGELFATRTKPLASTITATMNLSLAFVITLIVPMLKDFIGFQGIFWLFAVNATIGLVFVIFYVPETKGKSFQEILKILDK